MDKNELKLAEFEMKIEQGKENEIDKHTGMKIAELAKIVPQVKCAGCWGPFNFSVYQDNCCNVHVDVCECGLYLFSCVLTQCQPTYTQNTCDGYCLTFTLRPQCRCVCIQICYRGCYEYCMNVPY